MIRGVNLGNWLILEKRMSRKLFAETSVEDDTHGVSELSVVAKHERFKVPRDLFEDLAFPVIPQLPRVAQKVGRDPHVSTCEGHAASLGAHPSLWSRDGFTAWLKLSAIGLRPG